MKEHLIVRFEVENASRVRVHRPTGRVQVLKHKVNSDESISRWVPFQKDKIKPTEEPMDWSEPIEIFKNTRQIFPNEKITFERLYHCADDPIIFHIGFQVNIELSPVEKLINRKKEPWQQTTTCFIVKNSSSHIRSRNKDLSSTCSVEVN